MCKENMATKNATFLLEMLHFLLSSLHFPADFIQITVL